MIKLTNKVLDSHASQENSHIFKKTFGDNMLTIKKYCKVRGHCNYTDKYGGATHSMCNLKHWMPN